MGPLFEERPQEGDTQTGMIYVVKSLSADPEIRKLDGVLHKIGFTAGKMEIRIQNAKDDPTFLMAGVHPVATYTLYNVDRVKLEYLLHSFFADARLNIEINDRFGKKVRPREWFLVSASVISEAASRLKDGSIVKYRYDAGGSLVPL
jgi:T5orf172 domain